MVTCPVCDADLDIEEEDVDEGESVGCDECGADLKVMGKIPLELTPADQVEEDEDEIFDDEDEDIAVVEEVEEEEEEF
jgi:alpha-aminoadipate/glutamate carrier protein LysW